jgi:NADPH:quinone reductase-like Zn-dependent oxidoreductase
VQLGRLAGAHVTATVRSEDKRAGVSDLGAHEVIDPGDFDDAGPFDVILELVGAPNMHDNIKALATSGRIVVIGIGAGAKAEVNLAMLMGKRGRVSASTLRARPLEEKSMTARAVERSVLPHAEAGELTVPIADTFELDRAGEAYTRFDQGGKLGKIVLLMP